MTADEAKNTLLFYFLWRRNCIFAATETGLFFSNRADFVAVDRNLNLIEVEIKVNKYDLQKELKTVASSLGEGSKKFKHDLYLKRGWDGGNNYLIPHKYYFAVPSDLIGIAKPVLKETPYGLIELINHSNSGWIDTRIAKRVKPLHDNKIKIEHIYKLVRKVSCENLSLRNNHRG